MRLRVRPVAAARLRVRRVTAEVRRRRLAAIRRRARREAAKASVAFLFLFAASWLLLMVLP